MIVIIHDGGFDFHGAVRCHLFRDELFQEALYQSSFWVPAEVAWVAARLVIRYLKPLHQRHMWWHLCDGSDFRNFVLGEFFEVFVPFEVEVFDGYKFAVWLENVPE